MSTSLEQLQQWMGVRENEHLEFKEAKNNFHFEKLLKYGAALANEGGGKIVLGVTDRKPRRVVGSEAFDQIERTKAGLIDRVRLRVDAEELRHPNGRVLVFHVPSRPIGMPIQIDGAYWMRGGEDLVPMTPDLLRRIFDEAGPDFSAQVCPGATRADLDPGAIKEFRSRWAEQSGNPSLSRVPAAQLLADAELADDAGVTYAGLVLLGRRAALGRHLAQAEVIFEYRSSEMAGPANQRLEFREGFLLFYDRLWETINLRNDVQHYQDGLAMKGIPTFSEGSVREAILNAVSHRDYRSAGSVFVRQYPRRVEIVSPGGFPAGITPENILYQQLPRNRRIAEAFARCDFVERAGQGANRMFEECIRQSKPLPDFAHTDGYQVFLTLHGEIQDPQFLRFLEKVGRDRLSTFQTEDWLALDLIHREQKIPEACQGRLPYLLEQGIIERAGGGRFLLSRQFYRFMHKKGVYTRKKGLDRETNKALLMKHIKDNRDEGSPIQELLQVLPALSRDQVRTLLRELRQEGKAQPVGVKRGARWFPGTAR